MTGAEEFQAEIIRRYDAPMYRAMLEVYGDQIHPGFLEEGDDDIREAALRATIRLAELAQVAPGSRVLETACGVGGTARYLAAAGFEAIITEDWTRHVLPSFDCITAAIVAKRERLATIASEAGVAETLERYALWCKASRTGNLGWAALVGTRRASR